MLSKLFIITLSRKYFWEDIMLLYLLVYGLVSRYVEYGIIWHMIMLFIFFNLMKKVNFIRTFKLCTLTPVSFFLGLFVLTSVVLNGIQIDILLNNFAHTVVPVIYCVMMVMLIRERPILVKEFILSKAWIFNVFLYINIVVIFFQINGYPLFIKSEWGDSNNFDMWCGLFGNAGTHELAIYSIFVIFLNFILGKIYNDKRMIKRGYIYAFIISMLSVYNDNMAFYVLLINFSIIFYVRKYLMIHKRYFIGAQKIKKNIVSIVRIVLILCVVFYLTPVGDFLPSVMGRLGSLSNFEEISYNGGSTERTGLIIFSLLMDSTYEFGLGFGNVPMQLIATDYNFVQTGINSLGPFLMACGIWITLLFCLLYSSLLTKMLQSSFKKIDMIINLLLIIVLSYYVPLFYYVHFIFWVFNIYVLFYIHDEHIKSLNLLRL